MPLQFFVQRVDPIIKLLLAVESNKNIVDVISKKDFANKDLLRQKQIFSSLLKVMILKVIIAHIYQFAN